MFIFQEGIIRSQTNILVWVTRTQSLIGDSYKLFSNVEDVDKCLDSVGDEFDANLIDKWKERDRSQEHYVLKCAFDSDEFENEKSILMDLKHPNIVNLKMSFNYIDFDVLVFDLYEGGDLFKCSRSIQEKFVICQKLISGFDYCWQHRIIHSDIKPENILLDLTSNPYISDFGLAVRCGQKYDYIIRNTNVGTPIFQAPEIVRAHHYSQKSDIWAFGLLIHELFLNEHPIDDDTDICQFKFRPTNPEPIPHLNSFLASIFISSPYARPAWSDLPNTDFITQNLSTALYMIHK